MRRALKDCKGWLVVVPLKDGTDEWGQLLGTDEHGVRLLQDGGSRYYSWDLVKDTDTVEAEARRISCGCCTNGCCCWHHQDTPNGRPPRRCELHKEATR